MKKLLALAVALVMVVSMVGVFAIDYYVPEFASVTTSRFFITDVFASDTAEVSMINEAGDLVIHITPETIVYFDGFVPLCDDCDGMTQMVREVLFGRTLAEVLDGRNMVVTYGAVAWSMPGQTTPISVRVLFETAVPLPGVITIDGEDGYMGIMTLPGDISDWDFDINWGMGYINFEPISLFLFADEATYLTGELVINGEMKLSPGRLTAPFWHATEEGYVMMVPLRAVGEALGYDVMWNEYTQSIMLGVGVNVFVGRAEAYRGRMAPVGLSIAPFIQDNVTFVPLDFVRNVLGQNAWVFEGQVVIAEYSDMF